MNELRAASNQQRRSRTGADGWLVPPHLQSSLSAVKVVVYKCTVGKSYSL